MKRALCCLLMLMLLGGSVALAAPRPIPLPQYVQLLRQVVDHLAAAERAPTASAAKESLNAAAELVGTTRAVQLEDGQVVQTDLQPLAALIEQGDFATTDGRKRMRDASALARQHLEAAQAVAGAPELNVEAARRALKSALAAPAVQRSLVQRLIDWLARLVGSRPAQAAGAVADSPVTRWIALVLAAGGVFLLARSLARVLVGNAGGEDRTLRSTRAVDRPLTPEELRLEARALATDGKYREALRRSHLALLQHFDRAGVIAYVPSLTLREYERMLRRGHAELARSTRTLHDLLEVHLYAEQAASAEDFGRAEALVDQLWREGEAASKSGKATLGSSSLG